MDSNAQLMNVRKIWDRVPHNAMTDLARFRNFRLCLPVEIQAMRACAGVAVFYGPATTPPTRSAPASILLK